MKYTNIPYVGHPVSRMVLGTSGKLFRSGGDVDQMIETALEQGINCPDTAQAYGKSEQAIGNWLKHSGRRNEIVLVSKCCHPVLAFVPRVGERAAENDLARSLEALGTGYIDIYMLHRDSLSVPVGKMSIYRSVMVAATPICNAIFMAMLGGSGYVAPPADDPAAAVALVQSASAQGAISISYIWIETIAYAVCAVLIFLWTVEKNLPGEQKAIAARKK